MIHEKSGRHPFVRRTGATRVLRTAAVVLVLLTCLHIWLGPEPLVERAYAQIPDAGYQRKLLLDETRKTNELLTEIAQILRDRTLNVRLVATDNQAGAPTPRRVHP